MTQRTTVRHGGRGKCAACESPDRRRIDQDLAAGVSLRVLAFRHGISKSSLIRHRPHLSAALTAVHQSVVRSGARSIAERIEALISRTEEVLDMAQRSRQPSLFLHAVRELREQLVVLAKLTGELNERPSMVVNLIESAEFVAAQTVILEFVEKKLGPKDRQELSRRLVLLDGGKSVS